MMKLCICIATFGFFVLGTTGCSLFGSKDKQEDSAEVSESLDLEEENLSGEDSLEFAEDEEGEFGTEEIGSVSGELVDEFPDAASDEFPDDSEFLDDGSEFTEEAVNEESSGDFSNDFVDDGQEFSDSEDFNELDPGSDFVESEGSVADADTDAFPEDTLSENTDQDVFSQGSSDASSYGAISEEYYDGGGIPSPTLPAVNYVSVKKMKPAAFQRAGSNVNRLYVVRPGDTMSSIARKIYGSERSSDLYSWNGHFVGKTLKVGDKVYYNSPTSPQDPSMKTFYEDRGMAPQFYQASAGENIRGVAKKLLGHPRSWMEIYATNEDLDSKGILSSNLRLRYWEGSEGVSAPSLADNDDTFDDIAEAPPEDFDPEEEEIAELEEGDVSEDPNIADSDVEELPEPEEDFDDDIVANDEPEVAPPPTSRGTVAPPPPPPSSVKPPTPPPAPGKMAKSAPPLPPPPKNFGGSLNKFKNQLKAKVAGSGRVKGKSKTKTLGLLIAFGIIGLLLLLFSVRRGRSKRVNFTHTQV